MYLTFSQTSSQHAPICYVAVYVSSRWQSGSIHFDSFISRSLQILHTPQSVIRLDEFTRTEISSYLYNERSYRQTFIVWTGSISDYVLTKSSIYYRTTTTTRNTRKHNSHHMREYRNDLPNWTNIEINHESSITSSYLTSYDWSDILSNWLDWSLDWEGRCHEYFWQ